MNIVVYSKKNCPNCDAVERLLTKWGFGYVKKSVESDANMQELLTLRPDARQMPQIFVDGQALGGLAGLQAALPKLLNMELDL